MHQPVCQRLNRSALLRRRTALGAGQGRPAQSGPRLVSGGRADSADDGGQGGTSFRLGCHQLALKGWLSGSGAAAIIWEDLATTAALAQVISTSGETAGGRSDSRGVLSGDIEGCG